jgi:hypothetical protein
LSLPHEQSFLRNVGKKAIKRTQKKPRRKLVAEAIVHTADIAPVPVDLPADVGAALPIAAEAAVLANGNGKHVKPQPRWEMIARLTKHWQTAVGHTRRAG